MAVVNRVSVTEQTAMRAAGARRYLNADDHVVLEIQESHARLVVDKWAGLGNAKPK